MMINVILCGGSGTRLWPLSRKTFPKQFVPLIKNASLFQETVKRNAFICARSLIVTNKDHYFMAKDQLADTEISNSKNGIFLLEPSGRNTAPAIALACMDLDPDEVVLVTPSDHLITDEKSYQKAVENAAKAAQEGYLVTFGIKPEYPETGYGYIEADASEKITDASVKVKSFREKPDRALAEKFIASGNFFWNSGMFVFKAGVFLDELKKYSPEIHAKSLEAYQGAHVELDEAVSSKQIKITLDKMNQIPSNSIDYAVMEKSSMVATVPCSIGWNDLGSFDSLYDILEKDENGNTRAGNVINVESKNNLVVSNDRKISLIGLSDTIIIDTDDALLVAKRGSSQLVKNVVDVLHHGNEKDKELADIHSTVHRPWGTYTVLEEGERYKIKKIVVHPGHRLSLQKHMHRSEHWVVVSGTASTTVGKDEILVRKNESIYIPIGENHRLANFGKIDLVIIETQVGDYVGEDDIIRIEDDFKRE